jgi:Flp pilus assembly protein TadD
MSRVRRRHRVRRRSAADLTARAARSPQDELPQTAPDWLPESVDNGREPPERRDPPSSPLPFELAEDDPAAADRTRPSEAAGQVAPGDADEPPADLPAQAGDVAPPEPAAEDILYQGAREAAAGGDVSRAIAVYRELLELNPRHVKGRNNLALLLDERGEHEAALEELEQCLSYQPRNPQILVNRGAVLGTLGRYVDAENDLLSVLTLEPGNAEAHLNLGMVISRKGLWRDAVPYLRRAIELDSSRATAYFYLGEALNHVDDLDGAFQAYQRAAELRPNNPKALYGLGIILDRLNRPEDAAHMYRRSRELDRQ